MSSTLTAEERVSKQVATPVDRYLLGCLYLMVMTGFGTLAGTGQLDITSVVAISSALAWRGYLFLTHQTKVLPEAWNTKLALGFAAFYLLDVTYLSRNFLSATVHLVMLGLTVKLFSPLRDRDYVLLSALSFAMVLAASVLTVAGAFFVAFYIFLLIAVATFVLLQMHRAATQATVRPAEEHLPELERRIGASLTAITPLILLAILAIGTGIFFILPRIAGGYAGAYSNGNDLSTGFSNEVRLGTIGEIQQSKAVVMHVAIEQGTAPEELKWRGVALSYFDGTAWTNPHSNVVAPRLADGRFQVTPTLPSSDAAILRYKVWLEPLNTSVFFLIDRPATLTGNYSLVGVDAGGGVHDLDREHPIAVYGGESSFARVATSRNFADGYSPELQATYLQLPQVDVRLEQLARQITAGSDGHYEKALALEKYLRSHYEYTLQLPATRAKDPLADFLFERKRGHCEYFASAMAVMLRTIGIPARVVNGFRGGEFNDLSGKYVVRAKDAHSWVEAYFPGSEWVSFDPTPSGSESVRGGWSRLGLYFDALSSFWREWVVNYDFSRQRSLGEDGVRKGRAMLDALRGRAMVRYRKLLTLARGAGRLTSLSPMLWFQLVIAAATLFWMVTNGHRMRTWFSVHGPQAQGSPKHVATLWYGKMAAALSKRGLRKSATQTAMEFAGGIPDAHVRDAVTHFTRRYELARFAASHEDAAALPRLFREICTTDDRSRD